MEFLSSHGRKLTVDEFATDQFLAHAAKQARERGFDKLTIVDAGLRIEEANALQEILPLVSDPVERQHSLSVSHEGARPFVPRQLNYEDAGGRLQRFAARKLEKVSHNVHRDFGVLHRVMDSMGTDIGVVTPITSLRLGVQPKRRMESSLAEAYNRWLVEVALPREPRLRGLLYLPLHDPQEAGEMIVEFGDKPGVVGVVVTAARTDRVYKNGLAPLYAALEERGLTLAFHGYANWEDRVIGMMDRFAGVQALGQPHYNMVHLANWLLHGMPERFPRLKLLWMGSGLAWAQYVMLRLDNSFMLRSFDYPLLKERPSHYMRQMFYCTQPLEQCQTPEAMSELFRALGGDTQFVWGSSYPSADFDLPSTVFDQPFLSDEAKRNILGGNALRLFGIDPAAK